MSRRMKVTLNDARILASDPQHQAAKRCIDHRCRCEVSGFGVSGLSRGEMAFDAFAQCRFIATECSSHLGEAGDSQRHGLMGDPCSRFGG